MPAPKTILERLHLSKVLLSLSAALAGWLAWSAAGAGVAGCGAAHACTQVLSSAYSMLFGLPVAAAGYMLYLIALLATVKRWTVLAVFSAWAILAGVLWFVSLQAVILEAWCLWCCVTHALAGLAAFLILVRFMPVLLCQRSRPTLPRGFGIVATLIAVFLGAGILAGLQQISFALHLSGRNASVVVLGKAGLNMLSVEEDGKLGLFNGRVMVDPKMAPVLGRNFFMSPAQAVQNPLDALMAPQPLVLLFDWTCPECRSLLAKFVHLKQPVSPQATDGDPSGLLKALDGVTVVLLPAWRDEEAHRFHTLMLAAWLAGGQETTALQDALAEGAIPVTSGAVDAKAAELFGKERWQAVQRQTASRVGEILALGAQALRESDAMLENATLPRMISTNGILQGMPADADLADFIAGSGAALAAQIADVRQAAARNDSRIQFESTSVTTAPVPSGASAYAEFHFTNTGTEPLNLVAIRTTCACTAPQGWKQSVAPGGHGDFTVKVDTSGHLGLMSRQIHLLVNAANAPNDGMIPLRITAHVMPGQNTTASTMSAEESAEEDEAQN